MEHVWYGMCVMVSERILEISSLLLYRVLISEFLASSAFSNPCTENCYCLYSELSEFSSEILNYLYLFLQLILDESMGKDPSLHRMLKISGQQPNRVPVSVGMVKLPV